jgi:hypothetical protein
MAAKIFMVGSWSSLMVASLWWLLCENNPHVKFCIQM